MALHGNPFMMTHAADCCSFSQAACLSHRAPEADQPTCRCIFGILLKDGRINRKAMDEVFKMVPSDDMTPSGKAACYRLMWEAISLKPRDFMTCESIAWCFRHLKYCKILSSCCDQKPKETQKDTDTYGQLMSVREHMEKSSEQNLEEWTSRRQLIDLMSNMAASLPDEKQTRDGSINGPTSANHDSAGSVQIDLTHEAESQAMSQLNPEASQDRQCTSPSPSPMVSQDYSGKLSTPAEIIVNIAGTSCTDFAGYGKREGLGGKTMQAFMGWCLDISVVRPMLIFAEIAGADLSLYEEKLAKYYGMWSVKVDPYGCGFPLRRNRLYVFMWCKMRASFSGSESEFHTLTRRKLMMKGEDLLCADEKLRWKISRDNAERHGYVYGKLAQSTSLPVIPFQHQVTAQTYQRYQDQVRQYENKGGCVQHAIFDVDHNVSQTSGGWVIPTLGTHDTLVHAGSEEVFLANEHMLIQGEAIPGIDLGDNPFTSCLQPLITNMMQRKSGRTCLNSLAGNSMHLHSLFSVMLYCLSSVKAICYTCFVVMIHHCIVSNESPWHLGLLL